VRFLLDRLGAEGCPPLEMVGALQVLSDNIAALALSDCGRRTATTTGAMACTDESAGTSAARARSSQLVIFRLLDRQRTQRRVGCGTSKQKIDSSRRGAAA
jgi:hypothetical protein